MVTIVGAALLAGALGDLDANRAAAECRAGELLDCALRVFLRHDRDEAEASGASVVVVGHHLGLFDADVRGEEVVQVLVFRLECEIANKQTCAHFLSSPSGSGLCSGVSSLGASGAEASLAGGVSTFAGAALNECSALFPSGARMRSSGSRLIASAIARAI